MTSQITNPVTGLNIVTGIANQVEAIKPQIQNITQTVTTQGTAQAADQASIVALQGSIIALNGTTSTHTAEIAGLESSATHLEWSRTQRMLYGESMLFFGLLLVATFLILWLYWRETRRVKALEAFFASELDKWGKVVKFANIKPD